MKLLSFAATVSLSSLFSLALAGSHAQKRARNESLGQIYAYGDNISGAPLFMGDGKLYIGDVTQSSVSGATNVSMEFVGTQLLVSSANSTSSTATSSNATGTTQYLSVATSGSHPVMVTNSTSSGYTTEGYHLFDTILTLQGEDKLLQTNFYAQSTDAEADIWQLYWDASGSSGTSVALKNLPPPAVVSSTP